MTRAPLEVAVVVLLVLAMLLASAVCLWRASARERVLRGFDRARRW